MTFNALSPRAAEQWVLDDSSLANIDGDIATGINMPASFGDCLLLDAMVTVSNIATMRAAPMDAGVRLTIQTPAGTIIDYIGVARWHQVGATRLCAYFDPMQIRYIRAEEQIAIFFEEVDTNATPTADLAIHLRVRRIRESPSGQLGRRPPQREVIGFVGPFIPKP